MDLRHLIAIGLVEGGPGPAEPRDAAQPEAACKDAEEEVPRLAELQGEQESESDEDEDEQEQEEGDDEELVSLDLEDGLGPVSLPCSVANSFFSVALRMTDFAPPRFSLKLRFLGVEAPGPVLLRGLGPRAAHLAAEAARGAREVPAGGVPPVAALMEIFAIATSQGARIRLPDGVESSQEAVCEFFDQMCARHPPGAEDFAALVEVREVLPSVYCLHLDSRVVLANMFVRVQEYYECPDPRFRHKRFSLEEYKEWYRTEDEEGMAGGFDYYLRWPGFNIPSWVLDDLRAGALGPLRPQEEALLAVVPQDSKPHYVIGTCERDQETLDHEMAHGLYATNPEYKERVQVALEDLPPKVRAEMRKSLIDMGYVDDPEIIRDEMQAYLAEGGCLGGGGANVARSKIQAIFSRFARAKT